MVPVLIEGLRRLEYRGYDSAGVAVLGDDGRIGLRRTVGKVSQLDEKLAADPLSGLERALSGLRGIRRTDLPPFQGGAAGT